MIKLWEYEYCGTVRIVDIDGIEFIGEAQEVTDREEQSDYEPKEDSITISCKGRLIVFLESEIRSIEKLG